MTTRSFRGVKHVGPHCPAWGKLVNDFRLDGTYFDVKVGGDVLVQFRPGQAVESARVMKIVARADTGAIAEVSLVIQGDNKQWRTVTPDKLRRVPSNRQEVDG